MIEKVRASCKAVAERAVHVHINDDILKRYALSLPVEEVASPEHDPLTHYLDHGEGTLAFFLILDTINFGSGYFPRLRKRSGMSGYFTLAASLNDFFVKEGAPSAQKLSQLNRRNCTKIFRQDPENKPAQELMTLFARALNDLGRYLVDNFHGSYIELVREAKASVEGLMAYLVEMPFFQDVSSYNNDEVFFYKRAQLMAADLSIAFCGQGPGYFHDLNKLTIFADNLVPHVLRVDGLLRYEDTLASHIDSEALIPAGSEEEIEIRACALHAVELMAQELLAAERAVPPHRLDFLLWNRGQDPTFKKGKPRHRTKTVFY